MFCLCLLHYLPISLLLCEMCSVCVCFIACHFHCSYVKWVLSVFASIPANFIVLMRNGFCLCLLHCLPVSLFLCEMGSVCVCFITCQFHCSYANEASSLRWALTNQQNTPCSLKQLLSYQRGLTEPKKRVLLKCGLSMGAMTGKLQNLHNMKYESLLRP